jgi:plastocyanin
MRTLAGLLSAAVLTVAGAVVASAATKSVSWKVGTSKTVQISKGGTVKWVWADGKPHNVRGPGTNSKVVSGRGKSFSKRFPKRGTYRFGCAVHSNMKTTVKVG